MKLRTFLASAVAVAASLAFSSPVLAQANYKSEYRMSLVLGPAFPWGKGGELWADKVREKTQGRINIKLYPGVSLIQGDQTREFSALRQGVIDMAVGSTINWSPQVKQLNLFSLPFLFPDYAAVDAVTQGEVGKSIFQTLEKSGVVPLAWGENGYREISNSKKPIKSPADLKGLKIRVVGSPLFLDTFTALGANPTQMSWADAQPAFASGAVDGQENPLSIFTAAKLHNVAQKYVTTWGYMNDPLIFVVNKDIWNSWTPADREAVKQAAIEAGKEQIAIARKGVVEEGKPLLKQIEGLGVTVTQLTPAEREAFAKADVLALELDPDDKDGQTLLFWYPAVTPTTNDYIRSAVKIESGAKSALDPHIAATVTPYVAQDLPALDLTVSNVTTVKPERTFWDKVMILHGLRQWHDRRGELRHGGQRVSRHYYDVHQLMQTSFAAAWQVDHELAIDCAHHARLFFGSADLGLDIAVPGTFTLTPSPAMREAIEKDYEAKIISLLEPVVGTGRVVAKVNVALDFVKKDIEEAPQVLQDKHFFRKHGENAYYGNDL